MASDTSNDFNVDFLAACESAAKMALFNDNHIWTIKMTFCVRDTSPEGWFRTKFTNDHLEAVADYVNNIGAIVKISGAVTYGIMEQLYGPNITNIAFESEEAFQAFKTWFDETKHIKLTNSVFIK